MSYPTPPPPSQPPPHQNYPQSAPDPIASIIPYKNSNALVSYYLGLFSIFPLLGLFMGVAALVLGIKGMRSARENPEAKGKVHAGIGIGCGGIGLLFNLVIVVGIILILVSDRSSHPSP